MPRFCSSCGAQMTDNAAFCPSCGKSIAAPTGTESATAPTAIPHSAQASGLNDNIAGLLAYLVIPAIIFLVVEPYNKNRFIRFHSFQAIFYWVASLVVQTLVWAIPFLGLLLGMVVWLAVVIGWIVLMIKAYQGTIFKLPVIGELAEKQANQ